MGKKSEVSQQIPSISVGTVLSVGKVVKILPDGVDIDNRGNKFFVSRSTIEKVLEDDLQHAVQEGNVAPRVDRKPVVSELGTEERRAHLRRDPNRPFGDAFPNSDRYVRSRCRNVPRESSCPKCPPNRGGPLRPPTHFPWR